MTLAAGARRKKPSVAGAVFAIGAVSAVLYAALYFVDQSIFLNGFDLAFGDIGFHGTAPDRGRMLFDLAAYALFTLGLFALYARLLSLCARRRLSQTARALVLGFPVAFNILLLVGRPFLSQDAWSYLAWGAVGLAPGGNPYFESGNVVAGTDLGRRLIELGWRPNLPPLTWYGPLWTLVETNIVRIVVEPIVALLVLKTIVVVATLGSAALVWAILARVRPGRQLFGTVLYLWNPLIVFEFAGEGHNDALVIFFVLLTLLFAVGRQPAGAAVALMLGVLTKYVPLIFGPAHLAYLWRQPVDRGRMIRELAIGVVAAVAIAGLVYAPFWAGPATLSGVIGAAGGSESFASTSGALRWLFQRVLPPVAAGQLTFGVLAGTFAITVLLLSWRVSTRMQLLRACAYIALAYVFVVAPLLWPWYVALPIALMALSPDRVFIRMVFVLAVCWRLVAPIDLVYENGFIPYRVGAIATAAIGIGVPLITLLVSWLRKPERRRDAARISGSHHPQSVAHAKAS